METPWTRTSAAILERYRQPLRILEAGGGSAKYYSFPPRSVFTVVDISPEQLASNDYADERVLSDLHDYSFEPGKFDIVVFNNVLEHLRDPRLVIDGAIRALQDNGALVIAGPIIASAQGLITKFTPHWFHVFVYRAVFRHPNAGKPGFPPFPAYSRWSVDPVPLRRYLEERKLRVVHYEEFESNQIIRLRKRSALLYGLYRLGAGSLRVLSLGRVRNNATDFQLFAVKPARAA